MITVVKKNTTVGYVDSRRGVFPELRRQQEAASRFFEPGPAPSLLRGIELAEVSRFLAAPERRMAVC